MKRILLVSWLVFFNFGISKGLSDFNILMRAGYVSAGVTGNDANFALNSYKLGLGVELGITKFFSIQPEISYVPKGFKYSTEVSIVSLNAGIVYGTIQIPFWLKYRINGFFVGLAPYLGFALLQEARIEMDGQIVTPQETYLKDFDFGAGLMIGYEFNVSKKIKLFLDIQYLQGLLDLLNRDAIISDEMLSDLVQTYNIDINVIQIFNFEVYVGIGIKFII